MQLKRHFSTLCNRWRYIPISWRINGSSLWSFLKDVLLAKAYYPINVASYLNNDRNFFWSMEILRQSPMRTPLGLKNMFYTLEVSLRSDSLSNLYIRCETKVRTIYNSDCFSKIALIHYIINVFKWQTKGEFPIAYYTPGYRSANLTLFSNLFRLWWCVESINSE